MGAKPRHDEPKQKPRVRMRVGVRPRSTSLPLAHDEIFNDHGSNTVRQGNDLKPDGTYETGRVITVYVDDVPKVMAKVETDHEMLKQAATAFWTRARRETIQTLKNAGTPVTNPDAMLPIPTDIGVSPNTWVQSRWPYDPTGRSALAGNVYFDWLTKHCEPEQRNPQAIFTVMTGRGMRPLDFAEVIEGSEHGAPVTDDQQNILATAKVMSEAFGLKPTVANNGADVAALQAQIAALTNTVNALLEAKTAPAQKRA